MTEEAKRCVECLLEAAIFQRCEDCYIGNMCECEDASECQLVQYANLVKDLSADLERVTRERDAAVEDLKEFNSCHHCIYYKTAECNDKCYFIIGNKPDWQWRGVKENDEVQHD